MVLCSHILWIYPPNATVVSQIFTLFGFWGVELFFVLSGFLIGKILFRIHVEETLTIQTVFSFLKRRWFRTLPNYYLVLLLNILIACLIGTSLSDFGYYLFFLQNFAWPMKPFFTESWSLSVEEFAYLLLPFALWGISRVLVRKRKTLQFLYVVILLLVFFTIAKLGYHYTTESTDINHWNASLKAVVIYRVDAILYGVLAAWISLNAPEFWIKRRMFLFFLGVLLIGFMFAGVGFFQLFITSYPFFWNVLYLPLTSVTFLFFLPFLSQWTKTTPLLQVPVGFVSRISYSVYLLHYGIVLQLMKYFVSTSGYTTMQLHGFTLVYLVVTFFLSYLFYEWYEKPIMDLRDR